MTGFGDIRYVPNPETPLADRIAGVRLNLRDLALSLNSPLDVWEREELIALERSMPTAFAVNTLGTDVDQILNWIRQLRLIVDGVENRQSKGNWLQRTTRLLGVTELTALRIVLNEAQDISRGLYRKHGEQRSTGSTPSIISAIPDQQVGPVQFEFELGILRVRHSAAATGAQKAAGAKSALESLVAQGEGLLNQLRASNCDGRLTSTVEALQHKLESEQDIVQLGMANIGCTMMGNAFERELPDAVVAMLRAYLHGIGLYLAQFSEWVEFAEAAAELELSAKDVALVAQEARNTLKQLEAAAEGVDPEVPRTVAFLLRLIDDPAQVPKRAAFAVIRTLENLVAKIFEYGSLFLDGSIRGGIDGAREGIKSAVSKGVMVALLTAAVQTAGGLGPIAGKVGESAWMQSAADVIRQELKHIGGGE